MSHDLHGIDMITTDVRTIPDTSRYESDKDKADLFELLAGGREYLEGAAK